MTNACLILVSSLALLSILAIFLGDDAFSTIETQNMTQMEPQSGSTLGQNISSGMPGFGEGNTTGGAQQQLSSPNMTTLQQPANMTVLQQQQQQPTIGQLPSSQLSQQQLTTTPTVVVKQVLHV